MTRDMATSGLDTAHGVDAGALVDAKFNFMPLTRVTRWLQCVSHWT
jgi:hypothetical protein